MSSLNGISPEPKEQHIKGPAADAEMKKAPAAPEKPGYLRGHKVSKEKGDVSDHIDKGVIDKWLKDLDTVYEPWKEKPAQGKPEALDSILEEFEDLLDYKLEEPSQPQAKSPPKPPPKPENLRSQRSADQQASYAADTPGTDEVKQRMEKLSEESDFTPMPKKAPPPPPVWVATHKLIVLTNLLDKVKADNKIIIDEEGNLALGKRKFGFGFRVGSSEEAKKVGEMIVQQLEEAQKLGIPIDTQLKALKSDDRFGKILKHNKGINERFSDLINKDDEKLKIVVLTGVLNAVIKDKTKKIVIDKNGNLSVAKRQFGFGYREGSSEEARKVGETIVQQLEQAEKLRLDIDFPLQALKVNDQFGKILQHNEDISERFSILIGNK